MRNHVAAVVAAVGLCLIAVGVAKAAVTNVYWRLDLHQGSYIIAYGQGATEQAAWDDCFRLQGITRAMTAAETRRNAVAAITSSAVRWCQNPKRYATVSPDPVVPTPVDCVVSEWSAWSDPAWLDCADGMQSRSIVRTRTIVTQPANGGTACPSLVETQAQTQACPTTPTPAGTTTLYINSGGPAVSNYVADTNFVGGMVSSTCRRTYSGIYLTRRYAAGSFEYRVPVSNGAYLVRLLTRECWNESTGQRVQRASIEGVSVPEYDTFTTANGGVISTERTVTVSDGILNITVSAVTGDAILNGIDVVPAGTEPSHEPATGTATLNWTPPTKNSDGSTLTDLAGYRIHYGASPAELVHSVQIPNTTRYTIETLLPGVYHFAVRAYTAGGAESVLSNVVSKTVP